MTRQREGRNPRGRKGAPAESAYDFLSTLISVATRVAPMPENLIVTSLSSALARPATPVCAPVTFVLSSSTPSNSPLSHG